MKRFLAIVALMFVATASNCGTSPQPVPTPTPDAAPHVSCVTVCQRGLEMGCKWADPTPNGAECYDVCANVMTFGLKWDLTCRTNAQSCADADKCP